MAVTSAGLMLWRSSTSAVQDGAAGELEVLIVHPGGPFWARKHEGAWSIPKGEFNPEAEDGPAAARREFAEELGSEPPPLPWIELGNARLKSGKRIVAWAVEGDLDADAIVSNTFSMQWPPKSGRMIDVPEVDEARWVTPSTAAQLLNPALVVLVDRLIQHLAQNGHDLKT